MKCAFINLGRHLGGAEYYLSVIIGRWLEDGNEAIVIVKRNSKFAKFIREKIPGLPVEEVDFTRADIVRIKKIFKGDSIGVIDINGINSGVFIKFTATKIPKVTTVHSNADMDRAEKPLLVRKIFVFMENYFLKKSQKIIVVSDSIKELLISRGIPDHQITVVNNGVKFINYPEIGTRPFSKETLKICYVGRLEKVKGCEYLIRALGLLKSYRYQCDIYGDGSLREKLILMTSEEQIGDNVHFMGFSARIRELLPEYDVLVLPSLFEAFPLIVPEAMNAKTLLICSNVGGIPWIIKNGINGYLFEKGNAKELSDLLKMIYEHVSDQKILIENAYHDFINNYTEDVMIEKTFYILKNP